jgi:RNA polymerase sigma-70 factor (ECF subfamily)
VELLCRDASDLETRRWLVELHADGAVRERALRRLHELLLKMAYSRLLARPEWLSPDAVDELALDAADQALVALLTHLDDFRGLSRFTTWACQFAVTEVAVLLRRHRRQRCELPVEPESMIALAGSRSTVEGELEQAELLQRICAAVNEALTAYQRELVVAIAIDGESPRALAASRQTSVGAVYKSLHDARRKLRRRLAVHALAPFGESIDELDAAA